MSVDRSVSSGTLSEETLERTDGALDRRKVVRIELAQKAFDLIDAHVSPARERAKAFRRRVDAYDPGVVAVGRLSRDAGTLHLAHEPTHGRRAHLLGGRELTERLGPAHQDGERRELRRRDAGERVRPAGTAQQVDGGGVQAVGRLTLAAAGCTWCHAVILVSKAN
jgi:hypothetical protein